MRETRYQLAGFGRVAVALLAILLVHVLPATTQSGSSVQIFGPKEYLRTTGAPNQYTDTIAVPAWVISPYTLHIQNGDPSGSNRISSATITVNGTQVAGPSDFNQNVAAFDRTVTLTAQTTLHVTLASKPGSYLILNLAGASADHTAPVIAVVTPANGKAVNTATPFLDVTYSDPAGTGGTGASGVNPATLAVTLDGADRTSLFTRRSGDASATLPPALALAAGPHTLVATIRDNAGNPASATSHFTVDLAAPRIQVAAPAAGSYLATASPTIHVTYQDDTALDLATLKVLVNGVDRTALFTRTATDATWTPTSSTALPQGANQITAQIADTAGNLAADAAAFNVDSTPPVVTIASPAVSARFGDANVPVAVTYRDDQAIDPSTLQVRLDGVLLGLTAGPDGAAGTATGVHDGSHTLVARVSDRAGNQASATVTFVVDTAVPTIQVTAPAAGAFVSTASPRITVAYSDPDAVAPGTFKVRWNGTDITSLFTVGATEASADLAGRLTLPDGTVTLTAQISNLAGVTGTTTSTFTVDTTPPTVSVTAPAGVVASGTPAASITYADGSSGIDTTFVHILLDGADATRFFALTAGKAIGTLEVAPPLADGPHTLEVTVADRAGNPATATASFVVDTTAPVATFVAPADNSFLNTRTPGLELGYGDGSGSGVDLATVHLFLARETGAETEITPLVSVGAEKATGQIPPASALADATWHLRATLQDRAGNPVTGRATFVVDTAAPTIVQLDAPAQLPPGGTGTVSAVVTDDLSIASVVFLVNGATVATVTAPPYQFVLTVPADARSGDTLTVTAVATDVAGNSASASRGVAVASAGVVVGQVLADSTGLPLPGATVQVVGEAQQDVTDGKGRYSLAVRGGHLFLEISRPADPAAQIPALLPVEREVTVQTGVGTVPVDARLTAMAAPVAIDSTGGTLAASGIGNVTVTVPAGAVAGATAFHLTPLSAQGLPALLPLGWSPVAAFDLRADGGSSAPLAASFSGLPKNQPLQLVVYSSALHAWTLTAAGLTSAGGTLTASLPMLGGYALVAADPAAPSPIPGQPLAGVAMVPLPLDASSSGSLSPPSLSPAGGTSMATLKIQSSVPLPSGTVIQANVTEVYTLTAGEQLSEPSRAEDLVLYAFPAAAGATLAATFPVTPSRSFQVADLQTGKVHLDILAGRENVRGETGGSGAVVVQEGDATLSVAAGSLPEDTAVDLTAESLAAFLPSGNGLTLLAQYEIDFGGGVLSLPAQLAAGAIAGTAQPGDTLLLAQIQRFGGVPRLVAVSLARVTGGQIVTQPYPGLPGITQGGEYVFYKLASPLGFVAGRVSSSGGPVAALISTGALPFVTLSDATGHYTIPAVAGTASLKATVPQTALLATGSVTVTAGQTAALDLTLAGAVAGATVNPPDGALGVDPSAPITITSTDALNPATVTAANVQLFQAAGAGNQPVAIRFVLAQGNRQISVFPLAALVASTRYTLQVTGLATAVGGLVAVPSVTFTTKSVTPPSFNPDALVFAFPDTDGNVAVSAPAGSFPPGSNVLIIDQTNGVVLSLTVGNDGSVSGQLPATIDDVLVTTITAPDKSVATFTRSQFVAPDGRVAVGAGGGTVTGPGGIEMRIPEGALDKAATFKIEAFGPDLFPERPDLPDANFGSGLKITTTGATTFKKEVKLAFPKPADAPDGSFFYVYRRVPNPDGSVSFQTIDHAFVEGTGDQAKVVTASPPFSGIIDALQQDWEYLMWTFDRLLVGIASPGLIVGKVMRTVPPGPGETEPTFVPIVHAKAWRTSDTAQQNVSFTNSGGLFTLFDPTRGGGTRPVTVQLDTGEQMQATAFELTTTQTDDEFYGISAQLYRQYRNIGRVQVTFPPAQPAPPAPDLDIRIFKRDGSGNRIDAGGLVPEGASLVIGVKSNAAANLDLRSLTVSGQPLAFSRSDSGTPRMDFIATQDYSAPQPGTYAVTATALPVLGGGAVTGSRSFRVIAAGGSNNDPDPNQPPGVLSEVPRTHSLRVPTTIFPQVAFSEPVKNLPGNVTLTSDDGQAVTFILSGVGRPDASGNPAVYPNLADSSAVVTSVTLQPTQGLRYGTRYILSFGSGIVDLDPQPKSLAASAIDFTTLSPQNLTSTDDVFLSPRVVVIGNYAYVAKNNASLSSELRAYDVSNPTVLATPVGKIAYPGGQPIDLAGEERSPATNNRDVVAVAPGFPGGIDSEVAATIPSRVFFFDVTHPSQMKQIGNVKMTDSATQEGLVLRVVLHNGVAYTSTFQKGIQIVQLDDVGSFFGPSIQTIPITQLLNGQQVQVTLYGLQVGDFVVDQQSRTLVLATGRVGLVVADRSASPAVLFQGSLSDAAGGRLDSGFSLALGTVNARNVALVVGQGAGKDPVTGALTAGPVLAVVDLTDPRNPRPLSFLALPETATDVTVRDADALALVGLSTRTLLVNLGDLANPAMAGEIDGIGGKVTLASSNVVFSTAFGGIHTAALGSACAAFRALLRDQPPHPAPIQSTPQLEWSLSGGVSDRDGLVLTDVKLGRRQLATKMSLPYLLLKRVDAKTGAELSHRCELTPGSDAGCTGASNARVSLLSFQNQPADQTRYVVEAQYLIDRLDGDPDTHSDVPDSCVVVTQRYEFYREGLVPFEPFGKFPSARFLPGVRYSYFTDRGPQLKSLTTAQRFAFDARTASAPAVKAPVNATMFSCDFDPPALCAPSFLNNGSVIGLLGGKNPLTREVYLPVMRNGGMHVFLDPLDHLPIPTIVDNFHSSPQPLGNPDQEIDEPGPTVFGCPACVHIHWRWTSVLTANGITGGLIGVDPDFNNNGGKPFLPPGSTQDVDIAVETSGIEHPSGQTEVKDLVSAGNSLLPSVLDAGSARPAFWYVATGHQSSDQFFIHGGGFGTFYVNKLTVAPTGPLSLQLEHSRAVRYDVKVTAQILVGQTVFNMSLPAWSGTLPAGQDDLTSPFDAGLPPETLSVTVDVTLDDDALASIPVPKTEYVRTFTLVTPGTTEP